MTERNFNDDRTIRIPNLTAKDPRILHILNGYTLSAQEYLTLQASTKNIAISTLTSFTLATSISFYASRKMALPPRMIIIPSAAIIGTWAGVFYGVLNTWRDLKSIPNSELVKRIQSGIREEQEHGKDVWNDGNVSDTSLERSIPHRTLRDKPIAERASPDRNVSAKPKRYNQYGDEIVEE